MGEEQPLPETPERKEGKLALLGAHSLEPQTYKEAESLALALSKSSIIPKELQGQPANCLIAIMFVRELGLGVMQGLQNVMVVNGRPSLWGDAVMARVMASDVYGAQKDEWDEKAEGGRATFTVWRKGQDAPVTRSFSMQDAKVAGLMGKAGPWSNYPKRMCFQRARAFALRDAFPDVLKGLRIAEEEYDINLVKGAGGEWRAPEDKGAAAPPDKTVETTAAAGQAAEPAALGNDPREVILPAGSYKLQRVGKSGEIRVQDARDGTLYAVTLQADAEVVEKRLKDKVDLRMQVVPGIGQHEVVQVLTNKEAAAA